MIRGGSDTCSNYVYFLSGIFSLSRNMFSLDELVETFIHIIATKDAKIGELIARLDTLEARLKYFQEEWVKEKVAHARMDEDTARQVIAEVDQ